MHANLVGQSTTSGLSQSLLHCHEGQTSVHLASGNGVGQHSAYPLGSFIGHLVESRQVRHDFIANPNQCKRL